MRIDIKKLSEIAKALNAPRQKFYTAYFKKRLAEVEPEGGYTVVVRKDRK
jgi:hypothetical protein